MHTLSRLPAHLLTTVFSIAVMACLIASAAGAQNRPAPPLPSLSLPAEGPADFAFTVARLDGYTVSLSEFEGRVLFVHFWATYCGICVGGMPMLQQLWTSLRHRDDVAFVMVAKDAEAADVAAFMQQRGYDFPVYLRAARSEVFSASGIPSTYIVDRQGGVRANVQGRLDWSDPSARSYLVGLADARR